MLGRIQPRHARLARGAQVVLVLVAVYASLSWVEGEPARIPAGSDHLALSLRAPVLKAQGPWNSGDVLTEASPGIPTHIAPEADITARYEAQGIQASDPKWSARLRMSEQGDSDPWWTVEREIPLQVDGETATMHLNLSAIMLEARALEIGAHVPGTLSVVVEVEHQGRILLQGVPATAVRMASLQLAPAEGVTLLQMTGDDGTYTAPGAVSLPYVSFVALAAAALLELALSSSRKHWPAWQRVPGLHPIMVHGLAVPDKAARTDLLALLRTAKRTHGTLLVDAEAHLAVLAGPVELVADTAPGLDPQAMRPEPARPDPPVHAPTAPAPMMALAPTAAAAVFSLAAHSEPHSTASAASDSVSPAQDASTPGQSADLAGGADANPSDVPDEHLAQLVAARLAAGTPRDAPPT